MPQCVTIEKLVYGGFGLARTDNGVLFVTDVAPGETVTIQPFAKKGGSQVARPLEIVTPSPARRTPPCPLAGLCGGCDWLHLTHAAQLEAKQDIIIECMTRIGKLKTLPAIEIAEEEEFSYRHRGQIQIGEKGNAGFFARGTKEVVTVTTCPLLVPSLNALLADLASCRVSPPPGATSLMVMAGDNEAVASSPVIAERTTDRVTLSVGGKRFAIQGNDFFQSNRQLLHRLGTWAQPFIGGNLLVDLYGGSGFFSLMLAGRFTQGLLIESIAGQAARALENFRLNGCTHLTAITGAAERLAEFALGKTIDCLIVDPPRPGLSPVVRDSVAAIGPATLLYVSCNPSTQARDLGFFVNQAGYRVEKAALFDLYPNTHHIETIMLLRKIGRS